MYVKQAAFQGMAWTWCGGRATWHTVMNCNCVQAVAIGAAIQAGLYDGLVSGVMVMDIWQATLMRAFATQQLDKAAVDAEESVEASNEEPEDV